MNMFIGQAMKRMGIVRIVMVMMLVMMIFMNSLFILLKRLIQRKGFGKGESYC